MPCELMFGGIYSPGLDRMDDASFRRPRGWSKSLLPTTFFCPPHSSAHHILPNNARLSDALRVFMLSMGGNGNDSVTSFPVLRAHPRTP
jgi:hypothetical protein